MSSRIFGETRLESEDLFKALASETPTANSPNFYLPRMNINEMRQA